MEGQSNSKQTANCERKNYSKDGRYRVVSEVSTINVSVKTSKKQPWEHPFRCKTPQMRRKHAAGTQCIDYG